MSGSELMAVISFGIMLLGALAAAWWRIDGQIGKGRDEALARSTAAAIRADRVAEDLAAHRLHVAEVYVSKQGLRETKDEIMEAIHGVKTAVDHMTVRVDRIVENQATKPRPRGV